MAAGRSHGALGEFDLRVPGSGMLAAVVLPDLQTGNVGPRTPDAPDDTAEMMGRTRVGGSLWDMDERSTWGRLNGGLDSDQLPPFADVPVLWFTVVSVVPVCPFSAGGASGAGSGDCLGSSPSYYETLQAADIDGVAGDELSRGRATDCG